MKWEGWKQEEDQLQCRNTDGSVRPGGEKSSDSGHNEKVGPRRFQMDGLYNERKV